MKDKFLKFLSLVTETDEKYFRLAYPRDGIQFASYEKSWAFFRFWFSPHSMKYFDGSSFFIIYPEYDSSGWKISLIKPYDVQNCATAFSLSQYLAHLRDVSEVEIRYVYNDEANILSSLSGFLIEKRYPQIIYDLNEMMEHTGSSWAPFRLRMNRFLNEYNDKYNITKIKKSGKATAYDAIRCWANSFSNRKNITDYNFVPDQEWYSKVIEYFYYSPREDDISITISIDGVPCAFGCASPISSTCVGIYSNVASTDHKGLPEFLLFQLAKELVELGYKYANIGHSSRKSEYSYKNKIAVHDLYPVAVVKQPGIRDTDKYLVDLINSLPKSINTSTLPLR